MAFLETEASRRAMILCVTYNEHIHWKLTLNLFKSTINNAQHAKSAGNAHVIRK